mgnify:CR=1 FL=1
MIYPDPELRSDIDVHRRHQPVAGDHLPRHRPVGRALRLPAGRPDRRRDRRASRTPTASRPAARRARRSASCPTSSTPSRAFRFCFYTGRKSPIPAARANSAAACRPSRASSRTAPTASRTTRSPRATPIPTSTGMMGGYPGAVNRYQFLKNSNILGKMKSFDARQRHPRAERRTESSSACGSRTFSRDPDDVYAVLWSAAGGFGDPLERDPAKVEADINNGDVSAMAARAIYGVVLGDAGATEKRAREAQAGADHQGAPSSREGRGQGQAARHREPRGQRRAAGAAPSAPRISVQSAATTSRLRAQATCRSRPRTRSSATRSASSTHCRSSGSSAAPAAALAIENEIAIEGDPLLKDVELR